MEEQTTMNPFPGLRSFEEEEDHLFFGREKQIDELIKLLRTSRFLAVVGYSGSGKSSLVKSGLIPSLYSGAMSGTSSSWRIGVFRPGDNPIGNMAACLTSPGLLNDDFEEEDQEPDPIAVGLAEATLWSSSMGLVKTVTHARLDPYDNILLIVDQFEELFRFKRENKRASTGDEALAFVKLLMKAASQKERPIYIAITMRSEFLGHCTEFHGLTECINDGHYLVPRMDRESRRLAITGPIAVGGGSISTRLLHRLLNDVGDNLDQLPILQHALMRTWDYWSTHREGDEPLDLAHYDAIGGMEEALSLHADEAFEEINSQEGKRHAEKIFKTLTIKARDGLAVRRPTKINQICAITGLNQQEVIDVADVFRQPGRCFLMPPTDTDIHGETTLDISHESLMRVWVRLRDWVDENAHSVQTYLELAKTAARFQDGLAPLYRDPELQIALNWKKNNGPTLEWAEQYDPSFERAMIFLETSQETRDMYIARKEENTKRALRRSRILALVFGTGAFFLLIAGIWVLILNQNVKENALEAEKQRDRANLARTEALKQRDFAKEAEVQAEEARKNAVAAEAVAQKERGRAIEEKERAEVAMVRAEQQEKIARENEELAHKEKLAAIKAEEEAHRQKAAAVKNEELALQEKKRAEEARRKAESLRILELARSLGVRAGNLVGENPRLAGLLALRAWQFNRDNGGSRRVPEIHLALQTAAQTLGKKLGGKPLMHQDMILSLAYDPGKNRLFSSSADGEIKIHHLNQSPPQSKTLATEHEPIKVLAYHGEKDLLAAGDAKGFIFCWKLSGDRGYLRMDSAMNGPVNALAFSSKGDLLAAGVGGELFWRDTNAWNGPPRKSTRNGAQIHDVAFNPNGNLLAVAWGTDHLILLNPLNPDQPGVQLLPGVVVRSVAFNEDGSLLAAGSADGPIHIIRMNRQNAAPLQLTGHDSIVNAIAFNGDDLVTASYDKTLRLWHHDNPKEPPVILSDHHQWVFDVVFRADQFFSSGADRQIRSWFASSEFLARKINGLVSRDLTEKEWRTYVSEKLDFIPTLTPDKSP